MLPTVTLLKRQWAAE